MKKFEAFRIEEILFATLKESEREVPESIGAATHLFDEGILDSITTVLFLENLNRAFNLELEGDVLFEDDFQTISGIVNLLESHSAAKKQG